MCIRNDSDSDNIFRAACHPFGKLRAGSERSGAQGRIWPASEEVLSFATQILRLRLRMTTHERHVAMKTYGTHLARREFFEN
jgi:hypothetical protein